MYVTVTMIVPDSDNDPYDIVSAMADTVNGDITMYDVSKDDETWLYGGTRIADSEL